MDKKYIPEKVWKQDLNTENKFSKINRPICGKLYDKELPRGQHNLQLYSLATPNGVKVTILLEELLEAGYMDAEYDAFSINILEGEQFSSGFVNVNPNSKIPALVDFSHKVPLKIFESGSILLYLSEKFNKFIPKDVFLKTQVMNWLFWQMGSTPYVGGGFGHFYAYAPEKIKYCIDRFTMETKRQLDVLDKHLEKNEFMIGQEYTIADMAIWPWYGGLVLGELYDAKEFLDSSSYKNLLRWTEQIAKRPAVKKGKIVNKSWGEGPMLSERHFLSDFDNLDL